MENKQPSILDLLIEAHVLSLIHICYAAWPRRCFVAGQHGERRLPRLRFRLACIAAAANRLKACLLYTSRCV